MYLGSNYMRNVKMGLSWLLKKTMILYIKIFKYIDGVFRLEGLCAVDLAVPMPS